MSDCQNLPQAHFRPSKNAKQTHFHQNSGKKGDLGGWSIFRRIFYLKVDQKEIKRYGRLDLTGSLPP